MRAKILFNFMATLVVTTLHAGCGGSTRAGATAGDTKGPPAHAAPVDDSAPSTPNAATSASGGGTQQHEDPQLDIPPYGASSSRIMQAHFTDAMLIRKAVIDGRPDLAANPATVIANTQELDKLPQGWRPFVEDMQATAQRITNGTTVAAVAAATADLGVACGRCHIEHGGPGALLEPPPDTSATVAGRMKRHGWATERLWEGLATPSSEAWQLGSKTLNDEPFAGDLIERGGVDAKTAAKDFARLVARAPAQEAVREQAAVYAELLLTCGACHRALDR